MSEILQVPPQLIVADANTIRTATPVRGDGQWYEMAAATDWLLAKGGSLIGAGPNLASSDTLLGIAAGSSEVRNYLIAPHVQNMSRLWSFSLFRTGGTTAQGLFKAYSGHAGIVWSIASDAPIGGTTFWFVDSTFTPTSTPEDCQVEISNSSSSPATVYVTAISCSEVPRAVLEEFGSDDDVAPNEQSDVAPLPIYAQEYSETGPYSESVRGVHVGANLAETEARRSMLFSQQLSDNSIETGTSLVNVFAYAIPLRARRTSSNLRTLACYVYAKMQTGGATGEVVFSAGNDDDGAIDTATATVNSTSYAWYEVAVDTLVENMGSLDSDGGKVDGNRQYAVVQMRRATGTGYIRVRSVCILEKGDPVPALPTAFPSLTWTERRAADTVIWNGVLRVESLGLYIAYGYDTADGDGIVSTSTDDGETWTDRQPSEVTAHQWYGMAYETATSRLVAVGQNPFGTGLDPAGKCITSEDLGVTWTARDILVSELSTFPGRSPADSVQWQSVVALPGGRLAASAGLADIGDGQHYVATSDDGGSTWTGRSMPSPYNAGSTFWGQLAANADGSALVMPNNDTGADAATSADYGHTWSITSLPFTSSDAAWGGDVTYGDTAGFVAVGAESAIGYDKAWSSLDATTWTLADEAGATFVSYFVEWITATIPFYLIGGVASPTGTFLRASFDGANWYDSPDPDPGDGISPWSGAAYSDDLARIAMVNQDGVIVTGDFA